MEQLKQINFAYAFRLFPQAVLTQDAPHYLINNPDNLEQVIAVFGIASGNGFMARHITPPLPDGTDAVHVFTTRYDLNVKTRLDDGVLMSLTTLIKLGDLKWASLKEVCKTYGIKM